MTTARSALRRYRAYGLSVASSLPLPELQGDMERPCNSADITYVAAQLLLEEATPRAGTMPGSSELVYAWGRHLVLRMREGRRCTYETSPVVDDYQLRRYLLGPALGILLHQRGLLVLHGSAVEIGGRAVVFVGKKGAGKSTTAAALLARGHKLLTDDIVAIDMSTPGGPLVRAAYPQVRLLPDALAELETPEGELEALAPSQPKRAWKVHRRFAERAVPLRHIVALEESATMTMAELSAARATGALLEHLYAARFMRADVITGFHLQACASLTRSATVLRLERGNTLPMLGRIVSSILQAVQKERSKMVLAATTPSRRQR